MQINHLSGIVVGPAVREPVSNQKELMSNFLAQQEPLARVNTNDECRAEAFYALRLLVMKFKSPFRSEARLIFGMADGVHHIVFYSDSRDQVESVAHVSTRLTYTKLDADVEPSIDETIVLSNMF